YIDASNFTSGISVNSGNNNDSLLGGSGNDFLDGGTGIDKIIGTTSLAMGIGEKDTLTGSGWDYFVLGDSTNVYYNSNTQVADVTDLDYAVIIGFGSSSNMQLKTLDAAHAGNGYVIGGALYGAIGTSNYYLYTDGDNSGVANAGDNLIAAIDSSIALTTANLKSNYGFFVG
ncbi:MAG: hypothetical protein NTZ94_16535, partial [Verrucomicrobia bacterium]|nr:hypothetical protein [Verrucomicrobiota bacterium]